jgi:HK97 family phage major capsid protein
VLTITLDDLVEMAEGVTASAVDVPSIQSGTQATAPGWMMSQTMRRVVRRVKDTSGRPIWTPSFDDGSSANTHDQLLGFPVYINNDMPLPGANATSLAFGNLGAYAIRDTLDVGVYRFGDSPYTTFGMVGFLVWARSGGSLRDRGSLPTLPNVVLYQHSAT